VIPAGFIQDLLSRVDVAEVIGRHVELKRSGANLMGLCPFHAEKSPSFSVNPGKQFYYCFGCGAGGDAVRFLTEHLGLSFVEAVRDLAGGVGLAVPEEQVSAEERERRETLRERRRGIAEVLDQAAAFYRQQLKASPRAIGYLKGRGLSGDIAARFGLGFAPPGWRSLAGVFPRYDDPVLEAAGLVRVRGEAAEDGHETGAAAEQDGARYDWFRDRVMFPIRGVDGGLIGFGGRVLDDSKPKYMNSPETAVFSKGRELYGLFEARQALREKGYALVVEGYMDVVALAQSGFGNAVATLGTACTAEHVQKLFRFTDKVVFSFDGDAAGRRAAARALEAALPHAGDLRSVHFLFLPPEHDPDSYVRERGAEAFDALVKAAVPLSRQLIEHASDGQDLDTAEGRARLVALARPLWEQLPGGALRDQILLEVAARAGLAREDLARRWGLAGSGAPRRPAAGGERSARPRPSVIGPPDRAARLLLQRLDWWHELSSADHEFLIALPGWHAQLFAWLDRWLTEHGPASWAELRPAVEAEAFGAQALALVDGAVLLDEPLLDDLRAALLQARRPQGPFALPALIGPR
jgi:DNA primase